jgi:hypothetical protein
MDLSKSWAIKCSKKLCYTHWRSQTYTERGGQYCSWVIKMGIFEKGKFFTKILKIGKNIKENL